MNKAERILAERRKKSAPDLLISSAFSQQKAFIQDPAKLKALFCTRRAAKSFTAGLYLVHEALANPGCNLLFIGLTRLSAKGILWKDILRVIDRRQGLSCRFNLAELTMTFPNGSVIRLSGIDADEEEMNKLLGMKYRLVCIDEASMYSIDLRNLVYGVLKPAMTDPNAEGDRGTICLMGTSSNFTRGLFYDITTGKEPGWSLHTWSAHDNPHVAKQWAEELKEIATLRPGYMETPQYKQWYLNLWVVDEGKLVYRFNPEHNWFKNRPMLEPSGWTYVLGVDLGWEDDNAFVLCGYHVVSPILFVIKVEAKRRQTFDQVSETILAFMADKEYPISKVIIDGANKQGVESMRQRSAIPFEYADKRDKATFIELLNADLVQAKIKLSPECGPLADEMMALVWKTDGDKIILPKKEHPALPNHRCDAFLYAWRHCYTYHFSPQEAKKAPLYSSAWFEQNCTIDWEAEREKLLSDVAWTEDANWPSS